jgi:hypothetical protein
LVCDKLILAMVSNLKIPPPLVTSSSPTIYYTESFWILPRSRILAEITIDSVSVSRGIHDRQADDNGSRSNHFVVRGHLPTCRSIKTKNGDSHRSHCKHSCFVIFDALSSFTAFSAKPRLRHPLDRFYSRL